MKRRISTLILLIAATPALAYERWECKQSKYDQQVALVAIDATGNTGSVTALGRTNEALVYFEGLNKRWSFTGTSESLNYALVLKPEQRAYYYDYSRGESVSASASYYCELVSTAYPTSDEQAIEFEMKPIESEKKSIESEK